MKTNKSFTKRFKVTRKGKILARKPGRDHFNAKETRKSQLNKNRTRNLSLPSRITRRFSVSK